MPNGLSFKVNTTGEWSLPDAEALVYSVGEKTRAEWVKQAQTNISSRKLSAEYVRNIQPVVMETTGDTVVSRVTLTDSADGLVSKLENGSGSYDMKKGLLNGPKSRMGKNGRYNIVPFSHNKPGPSRKSVPTKVFDSLRAGGGRLPTTGPQGSHTKSRASGLISKAPRYSGLIERPVAGRGTVLETYRTVSENSDDKSWIHPGFDVLGLAEKVATIISRELKGIVEKV